jgi:tetratricopeptide (TPR) repeat protein
VKYYFTSRELRIISCILLHDCCEISDGRRIGTMRLNDALFKNSSKAFLVTKDDENWEDFSKFDLEPLSGATLAKEYVPGPFEGSFIVAGKVVTRDEASQDCYLEVVLPERICEFCFLLVDDEIVRKRGRRVSDGTAIPVIAIEKFGVPQLFYARENPSVGIAVLQRGLQQAKEKKDIAYDLAVLLRQEKRNEEAIEAFSICLKEAPESAIACSLYQQRWQLNSEIGEVERAAEDKRLWEVAFNRAYGRHPTPDDIQANFESGLGPKSR